MPVERVDRLTWETLAAARDPGFYGRADWLDAICSARGLEPQYLVVTAHGTPAVRVALVHRRRAGASMLLVPASAAWCGFAEAFPDDLAAERIEGRRHEAFDELAAWCEAESAYARIVLPPESIDVRPFLWRGWRSEHRYTYRFDDAPALRSTARRWLRKAQEAGLEIVRPEGDDAVAALDTTIPPTFRRQREPLPVHEAAWRGYLAALVAMPAVRVVAAVAGGRVHASMAVGYDSCRAYELLAGVSDEALENGASVLVMCAAIDDALATAGSFDLAGANIPSIARYKRGFGGTLVPYAAVSRARSPIARWLAEGAPRLRRRLRYGR